MDAFPNVAFKEWASITGLLGSGQQILILRKGGIAEGRDGFQVEHRQFWFFPTRFHDEENKVKPGVPVDLPASDRITVPFQFFSTVTAMVWLEDWKKVRALDAHHGWTEETIRARFESLGREGIFLILVRVQALATPFTIPWIEEYAGCKSWITLNGVPAFASARYVLEEDAYQSKEAAILDCIRG